MTDQPGTEGPADDLVEEAVDHLQAFELTEYEARCLVALVRLGTGTAKDVSRVSAVPQARVYDCMDSLQARGLVNVQQSTPRRFRGRSPGPLVETLRLEYERRADRIEDLFGRVHAARQADHGGDVWVIEGLEAVTERLEALVDSADDEVLVALATEELVTDSLLDSLAGATDRGVEVTIASPGEPIRARLRSALPSAAVVETWTWWAEYPVRPGALTAVALVDSEGLLACADDAAVPGRAFRAVWTDAGDTPLVRLLRPLLASAIDPTQE